MKVTIELSQDIMSKSRKFVYFRKSDSCHLTDCMTTVQAKVVADSMRQLGIEVINNTGLIF